MSEFLLSDFGLFWGRLHPIMVHFPVALVMVLLALLILTRFQRFEGASPLVPIVLWATFLSSLMAVWMGLSLEETGRAAGEMLEEHKFLGIIMTVILGLAVMGYHFIKTYRELCVLTMSGLAAIMTIVTGHHGGAITHGESYLSSVSPGWLGGQHLLSTNVDWAVTGHPDSITVLEGMIHPVLTAKCLDCHQTQNKFGGLNFESVDSLLAGGQSGPLWEAGHSNNSRLIHRVSLSREDPRFMPPSGEPLSYQEMRLMAWWIDGGADTDLTLNSVPDDLKPWVLARAGLDLTERPYLETVTVERPDPELIPDLEASGWRIGFLSAQNGLMEVEWTGKDGEASFEGWEHIQSGIAWLDLSELSEISNLPEQTQVPHLTKLTLKDQALSRTDLEKFLPSTHLESINLVGASLEKGTLEVLEEFPELKRVFLWNASFDEGEIQRLQAARPDLDINLGFTFSAPQSAGL